MQHRLTNKSNKMISKKRSLYLIALLTCTLCSWMRASVPDVLVAASDLATSKADSAVEICEDYFLQAKANEDTYGMVQALLTQSTIHHISLQYTQSFDIAGEALFLAEQNGDSLALAYAYRRFGVMNAVFFQEEESEHYLNLATAFFKDLAKAEKAPIQEAVSTYFELVATQVSFENYENALIYMDSCFSISEKHLPGASNRYLNAQKGIIFLNQGLYKEAIDILKFSIKQFEALDEGTKIEFDRKAYVIVPYTFLAEAYKMTRQTKLAEKYFQKAFEIQNITNRFDSHKVDLLQHYAAFKYEQGEYKAAYAMMNEADSLKDLYFSPQALAHDGFLKVRNLYRDRLETKNEELIAKERSITKLRIIIFGVLSILIFALLYYRSKVVVKKYKREKKEAADLLNVKNKELTASTLKLIEQETLLTTLSEHIKENDNSPEGKKILRSMKTRNISLWEDFNQRFIAVNTGFYERLNHKIPGLSPSDLKVCALIRLNFSGKEMAQLLGISTASVNTARYRLRKKIGLDRDDNLTNFIAKI